MSLSFNGPFGAVLLPQKIDAFILNENMIFFSFHRALSDNVKSRLFSVAATRLAGQYSSGF